MDRIATPYHAYSLSLWLGTSYVATVRHLATTRLLARTLADSWARIPPRTLKLDLAGDYVPAEMRNDVWLIDQRQTREPIEARPGDRVVLTLDENASTGYSWREVDRSPAVRVIADSYIDDWEPRFIAQAHEPYAELDGAARPRCFVIEIDPAAVVLAEVGEPTRFTSADQLASWAGLTPTERSSEEHTRRRGAKIARVALARRLLTLCFYALRDQAGCRAFPVAARIPASRRIRAGALAKSHDLPHGTVAP
jgi:hypothetical protein